VLGGLLVSFVPGLPQISIHPDFIFLSVLPPLLFASAIQTSWEEFKYNLFSIGSLAFGLVGFTIIGVSLTAHWFIPGFDWRLGLVLGAAVAPTDAIAATSIAQRVGLPKRIVDLLEGESLINDASGLMALEFSTALVVDGIAPSVSGGILRLLYLVGVGILIGWLLGKLVQWVHSRIDNSSIEIALTLVTPYAAYSLAEGLGASGVLATVAVGLYLGRQTSSLFSSKTRIESQAFWQTFAFLLNGIVFLMIGLELRTVLAAIKTISAPELLKSAAQLSLSVILLRLIWVYPASYAAFRVRKKLLHQPEQPPHKGEVFLLGWTGMRGVISLAAAIALPDMLADGKPFPHRNELIFLTFAVIFVTLVLQGLTLPTLIRVLKLSGKDTHSADEQKARRAMLSSALRRIEELRSGGDGSTDALYDAFAQLYRERLTVLDQEDPAPQQEDEESPRQRERYRAVAKDLRSVERSTVLDLRSKGEISDGTLRTLEHELDLLDLRFSGV
jgi:monovalent cation/hydrogen antiporter